LAEAPGFRSLAGCSKLQAAIPALAAGEPVGKVARMVGYESPSAFVAAFRRETGMTPATYFRSVEPP
jgi:AraC-like DNA-binding protein